MQLSERRDVRRLLAAVLAAILVHVGLIFAIPFLTSLDTAPLPDYGPIVVTLEEPERLFEPPEPAPSPKPSPAPTPQPTARPVPTAKPAPTVKPAPAATNAAKTAAAPTAVPAPARAPGTSSFRQSGAAAGTSAGTASESIVSGPPPVVLPAVGSTTPGTGEQRSGEAVLLSGKPAPGSVGTLDTKKLDSSLARTATAAATGAAAASGTGTGTAAAAAEIVWDEPDAAKGRGLLSWPDVRLPDTVGKTGLVLEVKVAFSVNADGLVTSARVEHGSGYPDVDAACLEALRQARFTRAKVATELNGSRTIRITLR